MYYNRFVWVLIKNTRMWQWTSDTSVFNIFCQTCDQNDLHGASDNKSDVVSTAHIYDWSWPSFIAENADNYLKYAIYSVNYGLYFNKWP